MKKLISFELRKLFKTKSFYICMGISLILIFFNALLTKSVADSQEITTDPNTSILKFVSNGMLTMILGIFTAIFVTEDFTCGTIKNIYAKGYSRNEVYLSKYIVSTISALLFLGISLLGNILISKKLFTGEAAENSTYIVSILLEFLLVLAYNSLFFVISITAGKLGLSIAFNILGPSLISLAFTLLDNFLKSDRFKFSSYWLDTCLTSLQGTDCSQNVLVTSLILSLIVIVGSILIGLNLHRKKEL